jgi:CMP-N,N'-diacetyllegionaminic acid synthase
MFQGEKVVGIVPARKGSKRLPNKNCLELSNKPLLCWSILAALHSKEVDHVTVSTDSAEIRNHSHDCGADSVIMRPAHLATDHASSVSVVDHALEQMEREQLTFDWVVLLQPTSPLRTATHIAEAFDLIKQKNARGVVSLRKNRHPIEWSAPLDDTGFMDKFFERTNLSIPSHTANPTYTINGALYIARVDDFREHNTFFLSTGVIGYVMNTPDSVDIDTELDFEEAVFFMSRKK